MSTTIVHIICFGYLAMTAANAGVIMALMIFHGKTGLDGGVALVVGMADRGIVFGDNCSWSQYF